MDKIEELQRKLSEIGDTYNEFKMFFVIVNKDNEVTWSIDGSMCFLCLLAELVDIAEKRDIQHLDLIASKMVYH